MSILKSFRTMYVYKFSVKCYYVVVEREIKNCKEWKTEIENEDTISIATTIMQKEFPGIRWNSKLKIENGNLANNLQCTWGSKDE